MAKRDEVAGLPEKLKEARTKANLTLVQASELCGIAHSNLSNFERGVKTPTLATLMKLAEAYKIDVCDLIPRTTTLPPAQGVEVPATTPAPAKKTAAKKKKEK